MDAKRSGVEHFPKSEVERAFKLDQSNWRTARVVNKENSSTLGGGLAELKDNRFPMRLQYDEMIYVIEGELVVEHDGAECRGVPGDILLLHKGSEVVYSAAACRFFYALYPGNWREVTSEP